MTSMTVTFKPSWANGGWLRAFTDPYTEVDGAVTQCSWSTSTRIEASPGTHRVRTFVRYRRLFHGDGGSGEATIDLADGEDLAITTSNGITNQSPFAPHPSN